MSTLSLIEVEQELVRLIEENDDLRARVDAGVVSDGVRLAGELDRVKAELDRVHRERAGRDGRDDAPARIYRR